MDKQFNNVIDNFITTLKENIDDMKEPFSGETSSSKHDWDTIKHPKKDRLIQWFKRWIKENEHQDGESFWDHFNEPQDAAEDFLRTVEDWNPKI
jgi:hypothetical protein